VASSSAEVGAGEAGPSNRLAESVPNEPQHDATSMDAAEATATLIEESAGSLASTQEQALLVNAFDQPALLYAAPTVPRKAWELFPSHASEVLRRVVSTAANGGQEHCAARHELLTLVSRLLHSSCGTSSYRFVPFAVESYGRLGSEAFELLNDWATSAASGGFYNRTAYLVWIKREISVALIQGNARLFKRFVGVLTQGIGRRLVHGEEFVGCVM
jgi:hypothetical protein